MKKKIIGRLLLGFPLGIAIGYVITIIISAFAADGQFYPCVPTLEKTMGSQLNAVIFQAVLCGALGSVCAASSVIWEIESWSIAKQSGIYFLILSAAMMPIAYLNEWMPHSIIGFISYFGIFTAIFAFVWLTQYFMWKSKINRINSGLSK